MPLTKFKVKEKYGLKNNSDLTIVSPVYDSIFLSRNGSILSEYIYQEIEGNEILHIHLIDSSGDFVVNITQELKRQNIDYINEFWQLNENLFSFQYSDYDSLELMGVFNERGEIIINPEFDEIRLISEKLLLCFHGAHYEDYDSLGNKNYGQKLYNIFGKKIEAESIQDYEETENGEFIFETTSKVKFKTNEFGKIEK